MSIALIEDPEMLVSLVRRYDEVTWIQQLRELVQRWWNVGTIYVDKHDNPIYLSGQPHQLANRVCAICLSCDEGLPRCRQAIVRARGEMEQLDRREGMLSYACHLGMSTMVVPIFIDGQYGGMIYTTGFFEQPPSGTALTRLREAAMAIDPALANRQAIDSVPVLANEDLKQLEEIVHLGVTAIVSLYGQLRAKEEEIEALRRRLERRAGFAGLVGSSPGMQEVYDLVDKVAGNDCTVLVRGESGTGKELVAQAIHSRSHRSKGPFVVQNCSAFNDNLLESELFGHVRGAFTGAISDKKGLFEIAHNGTLFLDEVAEMSPPLQAKLLRVLQDQTFWPVGATSPKKSNVRLVAATHRDLEEMVRDERFREDLYYRLNVISISLPPLRERRGDIPALVDHFLRNHKGTTLSNRGLRLLCDFDWPGNVRELANEIERMTVLAGGKQSLDVELVSPRIVEKARPGNTPALPEGSLKEAIGELEAQMIGSALARCSGNRSQAARLLGIARSNLISKIKSYGLES